jgi:hypothetical protein
MSKIKSSLKSFIGYDEKVVAAASTTDSLSGITQGLGAKVISSFSITPDRSTRKNERKIQNG